MNIAKFRKFPPGVGETHRDQSDLTAGTGLLRAIARSKITIEFTNLKEVHDIAWSIVISQTSPWTETIFSTTKPP